MIVMVTCYVTIMVIQAGILIKSWDVKLARAVGDFGMVAITSVFVVLATPCAINFHSRKK